jgi:hypothetical protein
MPSPTQPGGNNHHLSSTSEFCPLDIMNIFQREFQECTFRILQNISHLRNTYSEVNHTKVQNKLQKTPSLKKPNEIRNRQLNYKQTHTKYTDTTEQNHTSFITIYCLDSSLGRVPACDAGDPGSVPGGGNLNVCPLPGGQLTSTHYSQYKLSR